MSTKNGKRSRRKTEEELTASQDFKTPITKKDKAEDSVKMKLDTEEDLKGFENENGTKEEEGIKTRSRSNTPQNIKKTPTKSTPEKEPELKEASEPEKIDILVEPPITESNESDKNTVDNAKISEKLIQPEINGTEKDEGNAIAEPAPPTEPTKPEEATQELTNDEVEMEPLIVDTEDPDPELQFDESSDIDSRKGSPVLSRCKTRRSQTRNIPTPKTPKSIIDQNGDDKDSEKTLSQTPEVPEPSDNQETESESSQKTEETDHKLESETVSIDLNETRESFESTASMKVNVGGDLTREIDLTIPDDKDSFLNTAKDLTVVETIRRMSSRRAIRPAGDYRKILLKAKAEKQEIYINQMARTSVERLSGTKRKSRSDTPDGTKRFKPESSPGFMAYISSPLNRIKNKFTPGEVSASTPKLTSYRKQDILEDANISKIENEVNPPPEKKWCSIM